MTTLTPSESFDNEHLFLNKKKLENKLLTRLTKDELLEKKILFNENAPSIQGSQKVLLARLSQRPSLEALVQRNIIKGGTIVARDDQLIKLEKEANFDMKEVQQALLEADLTGKLTKHKPKFVEITDEIKGEPENEIN